jgi:tRNA nucleotidyltransferase (CCA-adding enzyme)
MNKVLNMVPKGIIDIIGELNSHGYEAYLVGGSVRDLLLGVLPRDWDITTQARPEDITAIFPDTYQVGAAFGTVVVLSPEPVEVTTFRKESGYSDYRRPDLVEFSCNLEEDLNRRDFTVNAMAMKLPEGLVIDPFGGREDINNKVIKAVGDPVKRFSEDALRMLRAIRFVAQLGFSLDIKTFQAIEDLAELTGFLSSERIRDEILKLLESYYAPEGLWLLSETGLLRHVFPELTGAGGLDQGKPGAPSLLAHLIQTVDALPYDPYLRLAGLLHDIGKLSTKQMTKEGRVVFYGHEKESQKVAEKCFSRLKIDKKHTMNLIELIRMHMVSGEEVGKKAIRRWLGNYGQEWVRDLFALRRADSIASGLGEENPFIDRLEKELEEILQEQPLFTPKDLAITGWDVMEKTGLPSGPKIGEILTALFNLVLEEPDFNTKDKLLELVDKVALDLKD